MESGKILSSRESRLILPDLAEIGKRLQSPPSQRIMGDHSLNPELLLRETCKPAAVLILLVPEKTADLSIVFTQRTRHLSTHAGQVSFPGGKVESNDRDATHTALREAEEETGLNPDKVSIIGQLGNYLTRSGYRVSPIVGYTETMPLWQPDRNEVEHIFTAPLSYLSTPGRLVPGNCEDKRRYYACDYDRFRIWGATAGMLRNFIDTIMPEANACR